MITLILKLFKKTILIIIIIIFTISAFAQEFFNLQFRISDKKILKRFENQSEKPSIEYIECNGYLVRCISLMRNDTLPTIVFVHGAPGSSADFMNYMKDSILSQSFNLLNYDRPGYGYSGFGESMVSLKEQAYALKTILDRHHLKRVYTVSHSFGGPISVRLAIDYPDVIDGMILLAPAMDPANEKTPKIAYLAYWPVFGWITPTALKVAADEKFSHIEELKKMRPRLEEIDEKVIHIHGTEDSLVPFENLNFMEKSLTNARFEKIILEGEDHFLPWTQHELIRKEILKMAKSANR